VTAVCSASAFGLLCPLSREGELYAAIDAAREIANEHNATARSTTINVYVLVGRIAQDDAEAARAISYEIRSLLDAMQDGIKACDPDAIREAANKARSIEQMLSPDVAGSVKDAIREARTAAREIVRRVSKAGERAADVVSDLSMRRLDTARMSFLDLDEPAQVNEPDAAPARGIDLEPAPVAELAAAPATLELEF